VLEVLGHEARRAANSRSFDDEGIPEREPVPLLEPRGSEDEHSVDLNDGPRTVQGDDLARPPPAKRGATTQCRTGPQVTITVGLSAARPVPQVVESLDTQTLRGRLAGQAWIFGKAGDDLIPLSPSGRELGLHAFTAGSQLLRGPPASLPLAVTPGPNAQHIRDAPREQAEEPDEQREAEPIAFGQLWRRDPPKSEGQSCNEDYGQDR